MRRYEAIDDLLGRLVSFAGLVRAQNTTDPKRGKFYGDVVERKVKQIDPSGPLPDRYTQSNYEAMNALKIAMEKSGFQGREHTMKLIEALEKYEGTIICASHDPGILDRVATRVYEVKDTACREVLERRRDTRPARKSPVVADAEP